MHFMTMIGRWVVCDIDGMGRSYLISAANDVSLFLIDREIQNGRDVVWIGPP